MFKRFITGMFLAVALAAAHSVCAQEHDYQQWDTVNVGRLAALSRIDMRACRLAGSMEACAQRATDQALERLEHAMRSLDCRQAEASEPIVTTKGALNEHDEGPVVMAELADVICSYGMRQQLFPVSREAFRRRCTRLGWKCDVIWVSDGDPSEWLINRAQDIPLPAQS